MANKLRDVFSNDTPEYKSTLRFRDNEAYSSFCTVLNTIEQEGCNLPVEGVDSISTYMQLHGVQFPVDQCTNISNLVVGPAKERIKFSEIWDGNKKIYDFYRYAINDGLVLETEKNSVVYMKLVFSEDTKKVKITYQIQYQHANSIAEIDFELNACISFLSKFYAPTVEMGTNEDASKMDEIFHYLRCTSAFISRLSAIEKELKVTFSTGALNTISGEDQQDIEELYLLLCKKIPLRLNAKLNSTNATNVEFSTVQTEPIIGNKIAIVFVRKLIYELLGQTFSIYTANAVINAVIKDIQKSDNKTTVFYGDTDSQPMYISFSGFLTEEQAQIEANRNLGGEDMYINAHTSIQYIKEYYNITE